MTGLDLTGRRALVTGAAQGLGEGMAHGLAAAGATVVVADLQDHLGAKVAESLPGGGHAFAHLDVTDDSNWESVVSGLDGLDILVNNAGIEITSLIVDVDADQARKQLEVNLLGTTLGIKHAFRAMRPGGTGHTVGRSGTVINVASVAATIAFPGIAVYSATKSGVDRLTRVAAAESGRLGYGVRVNCIYPGLVATAMGIGLAVDCAELGLFASPDEAVGAVVALTPSGRMGEVADMADAVVFLASDASRFVNGAGLPVDGGMGM
jgi:3alpha(or 20beta)-hydroxysteroid dehydrogenase